MNAQELYDEWTDGEQNGMRPKRVQSLRDDLAEATEMSIPHSVPELEGWLETMRSSGVLTRKLKAAAEGPDDPDEPDDEEDPPPEEDGE